VLEITATEAHQFHMWQTITGDSTDGYPGCPGLGEKSDYALDALELTDPLDMWDNVLEAYASKGLAEDDAILQARLARILHAPDYNFETKGIRLWNPTRLFW
jgi:DNA polymerase-1